MNNLKSKDQEIIDKWKSWYDNHVKAEDYQIVKDQMFALATRCCIRELQKNLNSTQKD